MPLDAYPFVDSGPYPVRRGNRVQPWIDGEPAFRRICEAIDRATHSVWVTITFMWHSFRMPDGRGSALEVLEGAARRGVDVRLICWRPDDETAALRENAFWGSAEHVEMLERGHRQLNIRWDRAHLGFCQHQKTWLIDAGRDHGVCFVGGINLNPHSVVAPGHRGPGQNHDAYLELAGPAVADVYHNFVQRWNEASERAAADGRWGPDSARDLPYPADLPAERGPVEVQIQRTVHAGRFSSGPAFDFAAGETTNLDQYRVAIRSARRAVYLENQQVDVPEIVAELEGALRRGVEVIMVLPMPAVESPRDIGSTQLAGLFGHPGFLLCGLAGLGDDGRRHPVHVHSKLMLVDDEWATIGSCNLHRWSLFGNGELNAAFRDRAQVRALRVELFREHLGLDTAELDVVAAFAIFRRVAAQNRRRHGRGDAGWDGLAVERSMTR